MRSHHDKLHPVCAFGAALPFGLDVPIGKQSVLGGSKDMIALLKTLH